MATLVILLCQASFCLCIVLTATAIECPFRAESEAQGLFNSAPGLGEGPKLMWQLEIPAQNPKFTSQSHLKPRTQLVKVIRSYFYHIHMLKLIGDFSK